jgi:hypothetical protein
MLGLLSPAPCICQDMRLMPIIQTRNRRIWVAILVLAILGFCIAAIIFLSAKATEPFTIDDLYGFLD